MIRSAALILALMVPTSAHANPSETLSECAATAYASAGFTDRTDLKEKLTDLADDWREVAIFAARNEGILDPGLYVQDEIASRQAAWSARGSWVIFSDDFVAWMTTCGDMAQKTPVTVASAG